MTVEDFIKMQEDSDHRKEMQAIDDEERADAEEDAEIEKQFQQQQKFPASNTLRQFADYETPEYGEVEGPGLMEIGFKRGMSALKDKFPTLRSQEEVEARLQEKAKREGIGLTDDWRQDSDVQEEIANREATGFAGYRSEEGREAARSDFIEEEAPPWEENPDNPAFKEEGFMPPKGVAPVPPETQLDENNPAVQDLKELNQKAVAGDKEAEELRAKFFEGMPKEEKAMAKEELGNYYIGPGGYAINLDKVDASLDREAQFKLLQYIPDHQKSTMLAKWGFLDPEDIKGMPDSPEYKLQELKGVQAIALQKVQNESAEKIVDKNISGKDALATKLYASQAELNAANNALEEKLKMRGLDLKEIEMDNALFMHGEELDVQQYLKDKDIQLSREELTQLDNHFTKKLSFQYTQQLEDTDYKQRVLDQGDAQFNRKFALMEKKDQQATIMNEFNMAMKTVETYIGANQFSSAVLASAGLPTALTGFDVDSYYKGKAKTSATDPIFTAAMGMSSNLKGYMASSGKDVTALRNGYYSEQNKIVSKLMKPGNPELGEPAYLDSQMKEMQIVQFDSLPDVSKKNEQGQIIVEGKDAYNNSKMHYRNKMRIKVFNALMSDHAVYGELHDNINNAQTLYNTKGSLEGLGGGAPEPTAETTSKTTSETTAESNVDTFQSEAVAQHEKSQTLTDEEERKRKGAKQRFEKQRQTSPVKGITKDSSHNFGAQAYSDDLASDILGIGDFDWAKFGGEDVSPFQTFRNFFKLPASEGFKTKNDLKPEDVRKKLDQAYKTGRTQYQKLLKKHKGLGEKDPKRFTNLVEAARYYNTNKGLGGIGGSRGASLSPSIRYYISEAIRRKSK